jgi:enamine deaminase RidA (YjgF/YER057c/UK114 family)
VNTANARQRRQVAEDEHGQLVGAGDFGAQAQRAFANVGLALAAAGARPEQVAKLTIFVVDLRADHLDAIAAGHEPVFGDHKPADALIGVQGCHRCSLSRCCWEEDDRAQGCAITTLPKGLQVS